MLFFGVELGAAGVLDDPDDELFDDVEEGAADGELDELLDDSDFTDFELSDFPLSALAADDSDFALSFEAARWSFLPSLP